MHEHPPDLSCVLSTSPGVRNAPRARLQGRRAVSCVHKASRTQAGVPLCCAQLWLSRACPGGSSAFSPVPHPLASPLARGCCWVWGSLLRGAHQEIVDGVFCTGAESHNTFLVVPWGSAAGALLVCCRSLAWLALEPGTPQGGDALPKLLIQ